MGDYAGYLPSLDALLAVRKQLHELAGPARPDALPAARGRLAAAARDAVKACADEGACAAAPQIGSWLSDWQ